LANHSTRIGFLFISIDWFFACYISGVNYQKYAVKKGRAFKHRPDSIQSLAYLINPVMESLQIDPLDPLDP